MAEFEFKSRIVNAPRALLFALRHPLMVQLVGGAIAGGIVGLAAFSITGLKGLTLAVVTGCICGGAVGVLWKLYAWRLPNLTLQEVTVGVKDFSELKFVVNTEHRKVAWRLFVEMTTRVATQPLSGDRGSLRISVQSLHSLFGTVREELKAMQPSPVDEGFTVEILAMRMLNLHLRPFLAKWHTRLDTRERAQSAEAEMRWEYDDEFRAELEAMREQLIKYATAFAELAGVRQIEKFFDVSPPAK